MARDWQDRLDHLVDVDGVPGAVLGVIVGGSTAIHASGVLNVRTGVAVTPDSVFQVGSITKVWTATQVMMLVEQGLVDLDAPVRRQLPEFRLADGEAAARITVRQLLAHTSGIEGDVDEDLGDGDDCLERHVAALASIGTVHRPGETWSYGNSSYAVLGRLVEVVTGDRWDEALREQLADPLGMSAACTTASEAILHRAAVGHFVQPGCDEFEPTAQWDMPRALGPAALVSCPVGDLLAFVRFHLDGGVTGDGTRLMAASTVEEMQRRQAVCMEEWLASHWGLGWMINDWSGHRVIGHAGNTIGQTALLYVVPDQQVAVALLTNGVGRGQPMVDLVRDVLAEEAGVAMPAPPEPSAMQPSARDLHAHEGVYERYGVRTEVWEEGGRLRARTTMEGPEAAALGVTEPITFDLQPVRTDVFVARSPLLGPEWVPVRFDGPADRRFLHVGGQASRRTSERAAGR